MMAAPTETAMGEQMAPSADPIMDLAFAFQKTYALRAAVELDLFTAIGEGHDTVSALAKARGVSERGARILCDFCVTCALLAKDADRYSLTPNSAAFLDRRSPAYFGTALQFLTLPEMMQGAASTVEIVRSGTLPAGAGSMEPEHPMWVSFAQSMAGFMGLPAMLTAKLAPLPTDRESKVLDIAAGHGEFGIAVARSFPQARVVALDWAPVLAVARSRAAEAGVSNRFDELAGDAFDVPYGDNYDLVLIPNFLHHFDETRNVELLTKVRAALKPGGCVIAVEFVPAEDRVSPPMPARFAYTMLTTTAHGDAYTATAFERMFALAGFTRTAMTPLHPTPQTAIISYTR
ncbi:MAG: methyltransferase domain-containing protein [Candidatus Eremiobacteraeota bacterium]|nr:methyltransferase domain-containing protein [Candidatus Eremiobacteraeota bacterium]